MNRMETMALTFQSIKFCCHFLREILEIGGFNDLETLLQLVLAQVYGCLHVALDLREKESG